MQYLLVCLFACSVTGIVSLSTSLNSDTSKLNEEVSQSSRKTNNAYNKKLITRPSLQFNDHSELRHPNEILKLEGVMGNDDEYHIYDKKRVIKVPDGIRARNIRDTWLERMNKNIKNRSEEAYKTAMGAFDRMSQIARSKRRVHNSSKSDDTESTRRSEISREENQTNQTNDRGNGSNAMIALVYGIRNKTNNSTTTGTHQLGPKDHAFKDIGEVLRVDGGVIRIAGKEFELAKNKESARTSKTEYGENNDGSSADPKPGRNQRKDEGSLRKYTRGTMERNNRNHDASREGGMGPGGREENRRDEGNRGRSISQSNGGNEEDSRQ